jgi:hypothetical protein
MTRPFNLDVRGEDHHHDRTRDAQGRMPSDVDAEQEFLHRSPTMAVSLREGGYRLVTGRDKGGWRDVKSLRKELPDIEIDVPLQRFDDDADVAVAIAVALGAGSSDIHHPPHPSATERLANERHDAAFAFLARSIAEGAVPMDDPMLDCVWIHAGTPWSRAVMHCRARNGIISSVPIPDGTLDPCASAVVQPYGCMDDPARRPQWRLICWATSFGRDELPDPMKTLRTLAVAR